MHFQTILYMLIWISISLVASSHAVLRKRDSRSLVGWVGIIWLAPIAGAALYLMLGINRIQRRAHALQRVDEATVLPEEKFAGDLDQDFFLDPIAAHLRTLAELVGRVVRRPLLEGNQVTLLRNGDEAYPKMIQSIDSAQHTVSLCTYIFDGDHAGKLFLNALRRAVARGVSVRLLIDDVGARYSWPTAVRKAHRAGIPVARFLPVLVPWLFHYSNLRNHRKILVVDGCVGFTGGLNIREEHCLSHSNRHPIRDVHFCVTGPVVTDLQFTFAKDWYCTTGERLIGKPWFPDIGPTGSTLARGIADGPDDDLDKLQMVLLGAIVTAQSSITIVTPYLLPDASLIASLNVAALRGVEVRVIIPEKTNHALVQWASNAQLRQLLERGCRLWRSGLPFDHSKMMIVDEQWSLFGSLNWDPRSLRLNFEFNVECYDRQLAHSMLQIVDATIKAAREYTLEDVDSRTVAVKLRDGFARVLTPYL